jgi:hypothetical protein
MAGFLSESAAGFLRNRWPVSYRNQWPNSSEYAPFLGGFLQVLTGFKLLAVYVEPITQGFPGREQRFVGHFHHRLTVFSPAGHQQAGSDKGLHQSLGLRRLDKTRPRRPPPRHRAPFLDFHQFLKNLAYGVLSRPELADGIFRPLGDGALHAVEALVSFPGQATISRACSIQLRQGEGQQRQRPRRSAGIVENPLCQAGLEGVSLSPAWAYPHQVCPKRRFPP